MPAVSNGSTPRALSLAQVQQYNKTGYTPPIQIYSPLEAVANREYFDAMMAQLESEGRSSYSINGFHVKCRTQWDMATHPRILDLVEDILGPNFMCAATMLGRACRGLPRVPNAAVHLLHDDLFLKGIVSARPSIATE